MTMAHAGEICYIPFKYIINAPLDPHDPGDPRPVSLFVVICPAFENVCNPSQYHHVRGGRHGLARLFGAILEGVDASEPAISYAGDGAARG